jgi:glycosyltransferase involved in cell wall biosynthesis
MAPIHRPPNIPISWVVKSDWLGKLQIMLSVVIIAKNEEDRIGLCLQSVGFADECVVLDSGSSDGTVEIAREYGARVIETDWPGHVAQKNRGMSAARGNWILFLDADERLSAEAATEIQAVVTRPARYSGYSFPRLNIWLGRPLRHGRWYPDRKTRLIRRGTAEWTGVDPHDRLAVNGPVQRLKGDIVHVPYRNFGEHWDTVFRYAAIQAEGMKAQNKGSHVWDFTMRPPLHFIDAYLFRVGLLDGLPGLTVAALGSTHTFLKWWHVWRGRNQ